MLVSNILLHASIASSHIATSRHVEMLGYVNSQILNSIVESFFCCK